MSAENYVEGHREVTASNGVCVTCGEVHRGSQGRKYVQVCCLLLQVQSRFIGTLHFIITGTVMRGEQAPGTRSAASSLKELFFKTLKKKKKEDEQAPGTRSAHWKRCCGRPAQDQSSVKTKTKTRAPLKKSRAL